MRAADGSRLAVFSDEQDMFERRYGRTDCGNLPLIKCVRGHEDLRLANAESCPDRLRAKGRKQRAEDTTIFEGSERGNIELWETSGQNEHAIAPFDAKPLKHVRESIRQLAQPAVGVILDRSVLPQPSYRQMRRVRSIGMTINGFIGDVEALAVWKPIQLLSGLIP